MEQGLGKVKPVKPKLFDIAFRSKTLEVDGDVILVVVELRLLLEVKLPYDPVCPLLRWSVGLS